MEREVKQLEAENQRLTAELAKAKEWLGGPRKRIVLASVIAGVNILVFVIGMTAGRAFWGRDAAPPAKASAPPRPAPLPQVFGVMVADGPEIGHWTLNATRCAIREDGVELTATGSDGHSIWIASGQVEVELPAGALRLDKKHCWESFQPVVERVETHPPTFEGIVDLDCVFAGNRLQGRIEFTACR